MKKSFGDYVTLYVESLNHSKHINSLLNNGIKLHFIKREYKKLTLTIEKQNLGYVQRYFDELGIDYVIVGYSGKTFFGNFIRNKIGLILGIIISVVALVIAFNSVFMCEISPTEKIDKQAIIASLGSEELIFPFFKNKLDEKKLNEKISQIEGVALSSVYLRGCVLHIDINEELDVEPIEKPTFYPIVADRDCIIEQIVVERGTAIVTVGQSVKKGDVLIAPYYVFDKVENITHPCEAVGTVYARVFYEESEEYHENRVVTEKTGQVERIRQLFFAGKSLGEVKESNFENYIETKNIISVSGFPFEICEILREETKESLIFIPFDSIKTQIEEELYEKMCERVKKDVQILEKWCIIRNNMGVYVLTGVLEYIDSVGIKTTENESG